MLYWKTTSDRIGCEQSLSREECDELAWRIHDRLYERMSEGGGTQYGIDLRTMKTLYPRQFRVVDRLRKAFKSAPC